MDSKELNQHVTWTNDELTLEDIKRGAELFKLLLEWELRAEERDGNSKELEDAS